MNHPSQFEMLIDAINSLPGVGKKSATKIAYHLLKKDQNYVDQFQQRITNARLQIIFCKRCGNISNYETCTICSNEKREQKVICVVANIEDLFIIENSNSFSGIYHILNGEISPRNNINPSDLKIQKLIERIGDEDIKELIIATNPTIEGEATAIYIKKALFHFKELVISRIALGLPMNSNVDYADSFTLSKALENRRKF